MVVPTPNRTAKARLSMGFAKGIEYAKSAIKGGQRISPLLKPSVNAPVSSLPRILCFVGFEFAILHSHEGFQFL